MSKKSKSNKETLPNLPSFEINKDAEIRTGDNLDKEASPEIDREGTKDFPKEDSIAPETQPTTGPTLEEESHESTTKPNNIMVNKLNFFCFILLAILGGFIGLQEFYRRRTGLGILAVLFCWTFIPAIVATIEALVWLFRGPEIFDLTYNRGIAE